MPESCVHHQKIVSQIDSHDLWIGRVEKDQHSIQELLAEIRIDTAITRNKQETFERIYEKHVEEAEKPGGHRDCLKIASDTATANTKTLERLERDLKWISISSGIIGGLIGAMGKFGVDIVMGAIGRPI